MVCCADRTDIASLIANDRFSNAALEAKRTKEGRGHSPGCNIVGTEMKSGHSILGE